MTTSGSPPAVRVSDGAPLIYRLVSGLLEPLAPLLLRYRASKGKEDPARQGERLGRPVLPRPEGQLIWVHAASVGEAVAALDLAEGLASETGATLLFTTGTVTSASIITSRARPETIHQFIPVDFPRAARRFVTHWRPDMALFVESDLWPNLIAEVARTETPMAVINGRMSARSHGRWTRQKGAATRIFPQLDLVCAASGQDAERYGDLGVPSVVVTGNLKFDVPPPPVADEALSAARAAIGDRTVFLGASIHPGEDEPVLETHRALAPHFPGLLTIIAPRHPERGDTIAACALNDGLSVARRSAGEQPDGSTDIWLFDTIGEMGLVYRLATVAFIGGSLVPHGGQNPIEPVKLSVAMIHGPHVHNFDEIYDALDAAEGGIGVEGHDALRIAVKDLLNDPAKRSATADAAGRTVASHAGASKRTREALLPLLDAAGI